MTVTPIVTMYAWIICAGYLNRMLYASSEKAVGNSWKPSSMMRLSFVNEEDTITIKGTIQNKARILSET
ncbi:hypothetical protein D3C71_1764340 [compost metagenome]